MKAYRIIAASFLLTLGVCHADVPTSEQECRLRNAAVCESAGVQFIVDGPCPPSARIVRPPGQERCEDLSQAIAVPVPSRSSRLAVAQQPTPHRDLAWVGRIERWLLPALVLAGGLAIVVTAVVIIRRLWLRRDGKEVIPDSARSILVWVASAALSAPVAYRAAGFAFQRVFSSFDNHDSAGPVLIAAPVSFFVFLMAWSIILPAVAFTLRWLLRAYSKRQE